MPPPVYHIAHILPSPFVGGTEHATLRIAQAMEGLSFRSTIFYPDEAGPVKELLASSDFEAVAYRTEQPSYRRAKAFLGASLGLAAEFRRRGVDLVHCADILAAFYAAPSGKLARLPVLCHVRCDHGKLSRRERLFLRPVDRFVFVSRDTESRFDYPVPAGRGAVVYDGLDVSGAAGGGGSRAEVRREFGIPEGAALVGMVARVTPAKDYETLAKAAARVVAREPRVRFLIVGDCSQSELGRGHYEAVKGALAARGLTPYFIFTGHRDDVPRLLGAMDIFVLCTHTEGLPLVILEAMARAMPVVATAVGGVPEVVSHGRTGLLHEHLDDEGLATQLLRLLSDRAAAASLGEAGREFVKANFGREQFARGMASVYREMLAGRRPRPAKERPSSLPLCQHPPDAG